VSSRHHRFVIHVNFHRLSSDTFTARWSCCRGPPTDWQGPPDYIHRIPGQNRLHFILCYLWTVLVPTKYVYIPILLHRYAVLSLIKQFLDKFRVLRSSVNGRRITPLLQQFTPDRPSSNYSLRARPHNKTLIAKTTQLNDQDFIIRSIYKDSYWLHLKHIHHASIRALYVYWLPQLLTILSISSIVHGCVCQLDIKENGGGGPL